MFDVLSTPLLLGKYIFKTIFWKHYIRSVRIQILSKQWNIRWNVLKASNHPFSTYAKFSKKLTLLTYFSSLFHIYSLWFSDVSRVNSTAEKVSVFGVIVVSIFPHSDWILRISPYSVRMRENTDQNNSEYGHFLRSADMEQWAKTG